jgi:uncharacterized RDD family membrane protein YckC
VLPAAFKDQQRWVTPEALNVAPQWVGLPLATPARRAGAIAVDLLLVALLSGVSGLWLLAGLALVLLQLRSRRGASLSGPRLLVGWLGAALIALLALQEARQQWQERSESASATAVAAAAAEEADAEDPAASAALHAAADALRSAAGSASAVSAAVARAASAPRLSDAARIAMLEAQLAEARKPRPLKLREELNRWIDAVGASFGWGIVYFSLLPAWWGGQTVGKKLLRLRVVELTGRPMTVMRCLKRYGGYAAGMATGGLGFAQLLWDANRQAIQDKTAHTVVIDLRAPSPVVLVPAEAATGQDSTAHRPDT